MAQLDSIWETLDGKNNYPQIKEELLKRFGVRSLGDIGLKTICDTYSVEHQYARNVYRGVLKEGVEVSEVELAMICDGGYSFFGGHSTILTDFRKKSPILKECAGRSPMSRWEMNFG